MENSPNQTFVVVVKATDKDLEDFGEVRYSLTDPRFTINTETVSTSEGSHVRETRLFIFNRRISSKSTHASSLKV